VEVELKRGNVGPAGYQLDRPIGSSSRHNLRCSDKPAMHPGSVYVGYK
jgi:hypothetical protein